MLTLDKRISVNKVDQSWFEHLSKARNKTEGERLLTSKTLYTRELFLLKLLYNLYNSHYSNLCKRAFKKVSSIEKQYVADRQRLRELETRSE